MLLLLLLLLETEMVNEIGGNVSNGFIGCGGRVEYGTKVI